MSSAQTTQAVASGDLLDLVSSSPSATIYPTDDALLSVLQTRFRSDLPYTRVGSHHLVVVNPWKSLGSSSDESQREYAERGWRDTSGEGVGGVGVRGVQPHVYEVATKMYLLMRRKKEAQGVLARGITASGKSTSLRLLTNQLLLLSAHSKKEIALANQIKATLTILDAFGNAKSLMNPNASLHSRFVSLHFSPSKGRIAGARILTFGLDKSRVVKLDKEERTYHIFYQFLNGATSAERDTFGLEDVSEYRLLASSGCYRLPAGPFSDDATAMTETRAALATMGFKPKHLQSIFTILTAILLFSNLTFQFSHEMPDSQATIPNQALLVQIARLLGVGEEELGNVLTTRTRYAKKKEVFSVLLDEKGSEAQRDRCVKDLYAILVMYVAESCNHRLAPPNANANASDSPVDALANLASTIPIFYLDQPGYQTRSPSGTTSMSLTGAMPLVSPFASNAFEEFIVNFADEMVNSFISKHVYDDSVGFNTFLKDDGLVLPEVQPGMAGKDSAGVVEVFRGPGCGVLAGNGVWGGTAVVSSSGKKLGGLIGVLARASNNWKSGKSGGGVGEEKEREGEVVREMRDEVSSSKYASNVFAIDESASPFADSPSSTSPKLRAPTAFTISHSMNSHSTSYSASNFVSTNADLMDPAFLSLLRGSSDGFIRKLMSGPGVSAERHVKDEGVVVVGQVGSAGVGDVGGVVALPSSLYANSASIKEKITGSPQEDETGGGLGDFLTPGAGKRDQARKEVEVFVQERTLGVGRTKLDSGKTYPLVTQMSWVVGEVLDVFSSVVQPGVGRDGGRRLEGVEALLEGKDGAVGEDGGLLGGLGEDGKSPFDDAPQSSSGGANHIPSPGSRLFVLTHIRPNDSGTPNSFDKRRVRNQVGLGGLSGLVQRTFKNDWSIGIPASAFCDRYVTRMRGSVPERINQCIRAEGWKEGVDVHISSSDDHGRVWLTYDAWKVVEDRVRAAEKDAARFGAGAATTVEGGEGDEEDGDGVDVDAMTDWTHGTGAVGAGGMLTIPSSSYGAYGNGGLAESNDNLLLPRSAGGGGGGAGYGSGGLKSPGFPPEYPGSPSGMDSKEEMSAGGGGGGGSPGGDIKVKEASNAVEEVPTSSTRRWWLRIVWLTTFWMPSFLLHRIGRMKRPDVRLAWREKFTIFWLIVLFNALVIFFIVMFGRLLCPEYDRAWSLDEVATHQGEDDYYVTIQGWVYDLTDFIRADHAKMPNLRSNTPENKEALAGQDLTYYFPPPLVLACPHLVDDDTLFLTRKNWTVLVETARHESGRLARGGSEGLEDPEWYVNKFVRKMREFRKGPLVWDRKLVREWARDENMEKIWSIYEDKLYDLTDYVHTLDLNQNAGPYKFLNDDIVDVFRRGAGDDITENLNKLFTQLSKAERDVNMNCLTNAFYMGETDFRKTARCQASNYLLIIASVILMSSMGLKFLAALQLGSKRSPELQDKFVLCQVPCYTEGEDSLRRTIDSLAALNYDDKRKLIFIICDGNIIGSGNDRTTPRIVLDILGVDPSVDPEPLLFKSVGEGSRALNYGKVYSGLYEFEGHVVPYMVVVKVGKPTERSKPGNRGKRDSQILLMQYLNRVHFDSPMNPLELEIYHQMRNVIGIDPAFYEYIFTIDADTTVTPDSLNRLVASSADDSSIIGICGETKLANEETSWWTMIQVYEYYISHHLSKAFESLFGSVTCLPGCFSLYRIRTADKGRPIIISNRIIEEYAEPNVDTLHKKNLFSLGEDRFLTTLLMKHFPSFKTKFCPDAVAHTMAPESWRVLFSQRRRWINSTVHNLCELVILPELFGFCCFSMRFFVFIDLLSTIILPATVVYLVYLIVVVATRASAFPKIAIIMLSIVYGLQAIIFIIKREFMLIGWMVVYILSYPVYSFFLPVYSFWCMDEFSWGNTRVVVGEGKEKKVLMNEDDKFDESMIPLKKFSEYEAEAWDTASRRSDDTGYQSRSKHHAPPRSRNESPRGSVYGHGSDYYRDGNPLNNNSNPNLRLPHLTGNGSQHSHSGYSLSQYQNAAPMSTFGGPQLPFMPFGGTGSVAGSDYGGPTAGGMMMPGMMGYQNTGSVYGIPAMMTGGTAPRNTMMSTGFGMGGGMFGSGGVSQDGVMMGGGVGARPMSTFSMATSVNPFAGPSMNPNPTDEELFSALRTYLSTQDLMSVTKKTTREAIAAKFPKADLTNKKDFLNQSIDRILSES